MLFTAEAKVAREDEIVGVLAAVIRTLSIRAVPVPELPVAGAVATIRNRTFDLSLRSLMEAKLKEKEVFVASFVLDQPPPVLPSEN